MPVFKIISAAVACLVAICAPCAAQVVTTVTGPTYLAVVGPFSGGVCTGGGTICVNPGAGIPLNNFATDASVTSQFGVVNSQIAGAGNQITTLNGQVTTLNGQVVNLNNQVRQNTSFAAAVGAMRDAIPNEGDRFAVRFNAASVGNAVGGGFSMSANLNEKFRASVNYAGSRGENVVSGGLNFSFN